MYWTPFIFTYAQKGYLYFVWLYFFHPLYRAFTGEWSWPVTVVGFVLIGLGILYQFYALYRNRQYTQLKWQAIRFGVMIGGLLLLILI